MQRCLPCVLALPVSLMMSTAAVADTIELQVLPINGPEQGCPKKVIAYQTGQPYQEGGYATDGMVNLSEIATQITLAPEEPFSATWMGTLKPQYRNCEGTAGMFKIDGEENAGPSYIRLQLFQGKAKVILDMTGMQDANGFTTQIIKSGLRQGNPRWTWGGTD
ncbi:hypothetical protein [Acaryochloris sp. IP29b_bin.148]|uniref:hypothetical protein n=1 Tax=Acaryochloris sp. IP29b_bin.148 TaxID=2969218 RepID=UPI002604913B|nr:hypothetical protein [Acaryochloris sp. IP29b_bin.148]